MIWKTWFFDKWCKQWYTICDIIDITIFKWWIYNYIIIWYIQTLYLFWKNKQLHCMNAYNQLSDNDNIIHYVLLLLSLSNDWLYAFIQCNCLFFQNKYNVWMHSNDEIIVFSSFDNCNINDITYCISLFTISISNSIVKVFDIWWYWLLFTFFKCCI